MAVSLFPAYVENIFKENNSSVGELPILDLGGYIGSTGYIDFLQPTNMSSSVMRFMDGLDRPGIAFHIVGKPTSSKTYRDCCGKTESISQLDAVITIFQRYTGDQTRWVIGGGSEIVDAYNTRHWSNGSHAGATFLQCKQCPFALGELEPIGSPILTDLLTGTDPDFQLVPDSDFKLFSKKPSPQLSLKQPPVLPESFSPANQNSKVSSLLVKSTDILKEVAASSENLEKKKVDHCALRGRCFGLALATPILQTVLTIANIAYRVLRLISFANLWVNRSEPLKDRCLNIVGDLCRVVLSPLAIIGLEVVALYGLFKPEAGLNMYRSLEQKMYGRALLS